MMEQPVNAWLVLSECAAGLAIIALLTVLVVSDERVMSGSLAQAVAPPRTATAGMSIEAHRKHVFYERRQRFEGGAGPHGVAGEMAEQSDQLPVAMR